MLSDDKLSPRRMAQSCARDIRASSVTGCGTALAEAPYLLPGLGWLWRADSHSELTRVALHVILLRCVSFLSDNQLSHTFFSSYFLGQIRPQWTISFCPELILQKQEESLWIRCRIFQELLLSKENSADHKSLEKRLQGNFIPRGWMLG